MLTFNMQRTLKSYSLLIPSNLINPTTAAAPVMKPRVSASRTAFRPHRQNGKQRSFFSSSIVNTPLFLVNENRQPKLPGC